MREPGGACCTWPPAGFVDSSRARRVCRCGHSQTGRQPIHLRHDFRRAGEEHDDALYWASQNLRSGVLGSHVLWRFSAGGFSAHSAPTEATQSRCGVNHRIYRRPDDQLGGTKREIAAGHGTWRANG